MSILLSWYFAEFISCSSFCVKSLEFSIYSIISFTDNGDFISSLPVLIPFISFSCAIAVARSSNTTLNGRGDNRHPWTSPDGQHWNQIDYILCSQRRRSSIQLAKTRPGADCGSDHELHIAKFRPKLKEVGKTTRPFRYDLNQIPNDYTVEVTNRFKNTQKNYTKKILMTQITTMVWSLT